MSVRGRIAGRDDLARQADGVSVRLRRDVLRVLSDGAVRIAEVARARVLVQRGRDRPARSALAASIDVAETESGSVVQATAPHAPYVEFGTSRQAAEPFLAPALAEERPGIIARAGAVLRGRGA